MTTTDTEVVAAETEREMESAYVSRKRMWRTPPVPSSLHQKYNIFVASCETFGYLAERLTACACSLLIGAHGAHSIRRDIYQIIYSAWHNDVMLDMLAIKF